MLKRFRFSDGKKMPWKNGLGVTTEIAIYPEGSSLERGDFHWRLSSARIEADNQFSQFNGFDRKLLVIDGEGLVLNGTELKPFDIFSFPGEDKIQCSLLGTMVDDLGVIYHRDKIQCEMSVQKLDRPTTLATQAGIHFLVPLQGAVGCGNETISKGDIFQWTNDAVLNLSPLQNRSAQFLKISLFPKT